MWILLKCYFYKCRHGREKTGRVAKTQGKTAQRNTDTVKKKTRRGPKTQGEKIDTGKDRHSGAETRREAKTQGKTDTGRDRQGGEMMWDSPLCCNYH